MFKLNLEVLEARHAPVAMGPVGDAVDPYTGLPVLVRDVSDPGAAQVTKVRFNVVDTDAGKGADVSVDYTGAFAGAGQLTVALYDVTGSTPVTVSCAAFTVSGDGTQWATFRDTALVTGHRYVVRASWADQVGGENETLFYCP